MSTTKTEEKHEFQAETRKLLDLMIHSLYRNKEIFLRELISNASDALDKLRFEALTKPELMEGDDRLHIRVDRDATDHELVVRDNGIGMSRDEVIANIGTIARSGTQEFSSKLKALESAPGSTPELIGQFGVGFYSCFMVADEVTLDTRKAGEKTGIRWRSRGDGSFTIEEIEKKDRGTTITLALKRPAPGDDSETQDFTQEWVIRDIVRRYSDFVAWPIEMDVEREESAGEDDAKKERKKIVVTETLNSMRPLWSRPTADVKPEEHAEFYKHLTHDWEAPRETIHFKAEGNLEYTALLYVPSHRGFDWMETQHQQKSRVSLYVKRVFILADCEELLPPWLRFVRGLVDSADLPLNVSRETLQHTRQMKPMQRRLVAKTLESLKKMLETDRAKYRAFFADFGTVLKEGIYGDDEFRKDVAPLALFASTADGEDTTLGEYIQRMPVSQKAIYYIAGTDRTQLARSPHLEAFKKKGYEVLLLSDPVDEFAMSRLREFDGRTLKSVERGALDFEAGVDDKERTAKKEGWKPLADSLKSALGDRVSDVRFGDRLTDSVAVLVTDEHGLTPQMIEVLRNAKQDVPEAKRILELNPDHPLIAKLDSLKGDTARLADHAELLLAQAQLAEGRPPEDPQKFNRLVTQLMLG